MSRSPASFAELLDWAKAELANNDSPNDARHLLCHVLSKPLTYLLTWPEKQADTQQVERYKALVTKRKQGWPVAYLTGQRAFWSFELDVNPSTLIPRPETELLVETVLSLPLTNTARVLDLGTGTGAIALALAVEHSNWYITAVDQSADAVALAKHNAERLAVDNVDILKSDWFSNLDLHKYDVIVSNPPYVEDDSVWLTRGDVRFEPLSALTSGRDGLDDIRHIINQAPDYLNNQGWIVLEHGYQQASAIAALLVEAGFGKVETRQDLAGLDRVTLARLPHRIE